MAYADSPHRGRPAPNGGRRGAGYRKLVAAVKARAQQGEPCCFCGGGFDWGVHYQNRWAFTVHHGVRLMEGGTAVPDSSQAFPAHRGCNSRDGLQAQNARRRGAQPQPAPGSYLPQLPLSANQQLSHSVTNTESDDRASRIW